MMILALYKGYSKGFILAAFSFIGFFIGLAAALKLSAVVASYLEPHAESFSKWLPVISFVLVFIVVVLLVNLGARIIRKTIRIATLGWLDRILGIALYIIFYIILFSVFLFFAEKMTLVGRETIEQSGVYPWVAPWAPGLFEHLGTLLPFLKDMFRELQEFFEQIGSQMA